MAGSYNEVTGAKIQTGYKNQDVYAANWEKIFGKKSKDAEKALEDTVCKECGEVGGCTKCKSNLS